MKKSACEMIIKRGSRVGTFFGRRDDGKRRRKGESGKKKSCLMKLCTFAYTSCTLSPSPSPLLSQSPFLVCLLLRDLRLPLREYSKSFKACLREPVRLNIDDKSSQITWTFKWRVVVVTLFRINTKFTAVVQSRFICFVSEN